MPAEHTVHAHQGGAHRAADDVGKAHAEQEIAGGARPLFTVEPVGQVQHHARKQTGLGNAQQQAQHVERRLALHKGHGRRDQAPGHHDPRDPEPRADLVHDQVAGDFRQRIRQEKQPRAQPVRRGGNAQVDVQVMLGQGDVGAVQEAKDVGDDQQGHQLDEHQFVQRLRLAGVGDGSHRQFLLAPRQPGWGAHRCCSRSRVAQPAPGGDGKTVAAVRRPGRSRPSRRSTGCSRAAWSSRRPWR